jgi:hypothetical protein
MSAEETAAAAAAQQVAPTPENVTAQANRPDSGSNGEISSSTSFKTLDAFRKEAPEIYQKFMESIQQSILDDFKRRSKRVIEAMKKFRKG